MGGGAEDTGAGGKDASGSSDNVSGGGDNVGGGDDDVGGGDAVRAARNAGDDGSAAVPALTDGACNRPARCVALGRSVGGDDDEAPRGDGRDLGADSDSDDDHDDDRVGHVHAAFEASLPRWVSENARVWFGYALKERHPILSFWFVYDAGAPRATRSVVMYVEAV